MPYPRALRDRLPRAQLDDPRIRDRASRNAQQRHSLQAMEPCTSRRAGVHVQHLTALFDQGLVAVPEDNAARFSARRGVRELVHQVEANAPEVEVGPQRQAQPAQLLVVVPLHGVQRRDRAQRIEDVGPADVAGVHDRVDPGERRCEPGVDVSVCVGDHADKHGESIGQRVVYNLPPTTRNL